jgi:DNA-binding transcriptional MocR family regulator
VIDQLTFADFLRRGAIDRHLRRTRPIYHERRDGLVAELGGLIFGHSDLSASAIRRGVRLLEAAVQDVSGAAD